jgi:hypothetical protein
VACCAVVCYAVVWCVGTKCSLKKVSNCGLLSAVCGLRPGAALCTGPGVVCCPDCVLGRLVAASDAVLPLCGARLVCNVVSKQLELQVEKTSKSKASRTAKCRDKGRGSPETESGVASVLRHKVKACLHLAPNGFMGHAWCAMWCVGVRLVLLEVFNYKWILSPLGGTLHLFAWVCARACRLVSEWASQASLPVTAVLLMQCC